MDSWQYRQGGSVESEVLPVALNIYEIDDRLQQTIYTPEHADIGLAAKPLKWGIPTPLGIVEVGSAVGAKNRLVEQEVLGSNRGGVIDASAGRNLTIADGCAWGDHFQVRSFYYAPLQMHIILSLVADGMTPANLYVWKEWLSENPAVVSEIAELYGSKILKTLNPDILFSRIMSSSIGLGSIDSLKIMQIFSGIFAKSPSLSQRFSLMNELQVLQALLVNDMSRHLQSQRAKWKVPFTNWINGVYCLQIFAIPHSGTEIVMLNYSSGADTIGITKGDLSYPYFNIMDANRPVDAIIRSRLPNNADTLGLTDNKAGLIYGSIASPWFPGFMSASAVHRRHSPWMRSHTDGVTDPDVLGSREYHSPEDICETLNYKALPDDIALVDVGFPGDYY